MQCLYSSYLYPKNVSLWRDQAEIRNTDGFYSRQKHTILNIQSTALCTSEATYIPPLALPSTKHTH